MSATTAGKGVPSFTLLYSRCVLGAGTQPGEPIFEDQVDI
jgi:hypothetical protein